MVTRGLASIGKKTTVGNHFKGFCSVWGGGRCRIFTKAQSPLRRTWKNLETVKLMSNIKHVYKINIRI